MTDSQLKTHVETLESLTPAQRQSVMILIGLDREVKRNAEDVKRYEDMGQAAHPVLRRYAREALDENRRLLNNLMKLGLHLGNEG